MTDINILQQRLERAKAALRAERKRAKAREDQQILGAVRRSGLRLLELETLLASRVAPESVSEPAPEQDGGDFWGGSDQS